MTVSNPARQRELRKKVNNHIHENVNQFIRNNIEFPFEHLDNMYDEETGRQKDLYEFYSVSKWLYKKLNKHNQPVAEIDGLYIWGRTTTGQAVWLDYVIDQIF